MDAAGGLAYYGGQTKTIALQSGSPCLGTGTATGAPTTDQRGVTRPTPPSMGSYDAPSVLPAITIAPTALMAASADTAYNQTVTASGGTAPYTFSVTDGIFPKGLTMATNGTITGTPTVPGPYSFTVTATDSSTGAGAPFQNNQVVTLVVNPPTVVITPTTLPAATLGSVYSATLTGGGGLAPYGSFRVVTGTLPAGLSISNAGVISGTPTTAASSTFIVQVTDSTPSPGPYTGAQSYTLVVNPAIVVLPVSPLPAGNVGLAYSQAITATGGESPYTFAVTTGTLPPGITLTPAGVLAGTGTKAGVYTFAITATDSSTGSGPYTGVTSYSLTIGAATVVLAPTTLPAAVLLAPYSEAITASGGTAPYTFAVTTGTLPAGITLATDGTLSGTPTVNGTTPFTITATDSSTGTGSPFTGSQAYSLVVGAPVIALAPSTMPAATIGAAYSVVMSASGGTAPYTFTLAAGTLPTGLTLSSAGTISGTPTSLGIFPITITATDSGAAPGPYTGTMSYSIVVSAGTITVTPSILTAASVGQAYNQSISASGGTAPYTFAVSTGLPAGLSLATNGTISGVATAAGSFSFTVTATDSTTGTGSPLSGNAIVTLNVGPPTLSITPATLTDGAVGTTYSQTLTGSGGTAPYTFTGGTGLPPGLTLSSAGLISGTPTATGTFPFTVTVTDSTTGAGSPFSHTQSFSLVIGSATIVVTPATLPASEVGATYSQTITASGGTAPYSFGISFGTIAPGLSLTTTGTLSGTPTQAGTFVFTVSALDSSTGGGPFIGSRNYSLQIDAHNFPAGLALMSVPSDYSSESVATTFGYASPVLALWDPTTSTYDVTPSPAVASLTQGIGYWVRFPQPVTIVNMGTPTPTDAPFTITLHAGWNMVGDPFPAVEPLSDLSITLPGGTAGTLDAAITAGVIGQNIYLYDGTQYVAATDLTPYVGYWVFATQDCTLSVPPPQ